MYLTIGGILKVIKRNIVSFALCFVFIGRWTKLVARPSYIKVSNVKVHLTVSMVSELLGNAEK